MAATSNRSALRPGAGRGAAALTTAMLVVATGACLTATTHPARAQPQDCFWIQQGDSEDTNFLLPDTAARYYMGRINVPPGGELLMRGRFPHSRYMSFNVYDDTGRPTGAIPDFRIQPDSGSTNPFRAGNRRDLPMRSYSLRMIPAAPPAETEREPNTLYLGSDQGESYSVRVVYRIYLPDRGRDEFGDTGLPQVSVRLPGGEVVDQPLACSVTTDQPSTGLGESDRASGGPATSSFGNATDPLSWERFFNLPRAVVWNNNAELGEQMPAGGGGGLFSDGSIAYIYSPTSRGNGPVLVIRGRIPETVDTYDGDKRFERAPLRYWSICHVSARGTTATGTVDCVFDEEVPMDGKGRFTIVASTPDDRPANARKQCGVAWLAYGADRGLALMRNQLPDETFSQAIQRVEEPGQEEDVLGEYMPHGYYTSPRAFERRGCPQ